LKKLVLFIIVLIEGTDFDSGVFGGICKVGLGVMQKSYGRADFKCGELLILIIDVAELSCDLPRYLWVSCALC
jgi:hypothetical protein